MNFESMLASYGPTAFGLVALLIIWKVIVQPFMKSHLVDVKELMGELKAIAALNKATAATLERSIEKLEQMLGDAKDSN